LENVSIAAFDHYHLVLTNIAMEAMAHRNRWFTELKNGDFPMLNNQMVYLPMFFNDALPQW
jgi:hypothetical protein